jgi:hypothetical protein
MLEYGNVGMMGNPNIDSGRGTLLRALDEQTLVPSEGVFIHYSSISLFLEQVFILAVRRVIC